MHKEMNEDMYEVLEQFRLVVPAMRDLYSRVETRTGLSGSQIWFLQVISNEPGIRLGTLASRLSIHQSTASNQLEKLIRRNLVRKEQAPEDKRTSLLYISDEGKTLLAAIREPARSMLQEAILSLEEADLHTLREAMKPLISILITQLPKHYLTAITPVSELMKPKQADES